MIYLRSTYAYYTGSANLLIYREPGISNVLYFWDSLFIYTSNYIPRSLFRSFILFISLVVIYFVIFFLVLVLVLVLRCCQVLVVVLIQKCDSTLIFLVLVLGLLFFWFQFQKSFPYNNFYRFSSDSRIKFLLCLLYFRSHSYCDVRGSYANIKNFMSFWTNICLLAELVQYVPSSFEPLRSFPCAELSSKNRPQPASIYCSLLFSISIVLPFSISI